jgi:hypothetical protein
VRVIGAAQKFEQLDPVMPPMVISPAHQPGIGISIVLRPTLANGVIRRFIFDLDLLRIAVQLSVAGNGDAGEALAFASSRHC